MRELLHNAAWPNRPAGFRCNLRISIGNRQTKFMMCYASGFGFASASKSRISPAQKNRGGLVLDRECGGNVIGFQIYRKRLLDIVSCRVGRS